MPCMLSGLPLRCSLVAGALLGNFVGNANARINFQSDSHALHTCLRQHFATVGTVKWRRLACMPATFMLLHVKRGCASQYATHY